MSKSFDIVMAGLIAGIVALTSGFLGVAGTVIGAVFGAILYQVISIFVKEPLENATVKKVEREIVYVIPLLLIAVFIIIFIVASLYSHSIHFPDFLKLFNQLEETTNNNLVRFMGIGLIVMGIYPLLQPNTIKRKYGVIILVLGFILLIRGLLDMDMNLFQLYRTLGFFDIVLNIIILLILIFVIIKILLESISLYIHRNEGLRDDNFVNNETTRNKAINDLDDFSTSDFSSDNIDEDNKDKNFTDKRSIKNKTIKSNKTSTMSKNRKFFK